MRILLKIILFPVVVALTIVVLILRFLHSASSIVLGILSGIMLFAGVGSLVFKLGGMAMFQSYTSGDILILFVMAFLCSPFGLPLIAGFLVELLDSANGATKAI